MDEQELQRKLRAIFLAEARELIATAESDLLALEKNPDAEERQSRFGSFFRAAHTLKGAARTAGAKEIETHCHGLEETAIDLRDGRASWNAAISQPLLDSLDAIRRELDMMIARSEPVSIPLEDRDVSRRLTRTEDRDTLRIPSVKLDRLLALIQRVVLARASSEDALSEMGSVAEKAARWSRKVDESGGAGLSLIDEARTLAGGDLQWSMRRVENAHRALVEAARSVEEETRALRMFPFADACIGLDRTVRDLAVEQGKEVVLTVEGGDIDVDSHVLETLSGPLLHLVRNAVDHGIESPGNRAAAGKPMAGSVRVSALLKGSQIEVTVRDDGRGLDLDAVRRKATADGRTVDEADLAALIFSPGFSTSDRVTEISGRGIGLDAVKEKLESIGGSARFESARGRGMTFILTSPITLASTRAVLMRASGQSVACPSASVRSVLRLQTRDLQSIEGRDAILIDGAPVPVLTMSGALGLPATPIDPSASLAAVHLAAGVREAVYIVDSLMSEEEIVVKPLGRRLAHVPGVLGASVLRDGRVALVINVAELLEIGTERGQSGVFRARHAAAQIRRKRRILVVDDSITTRTLEKNILEAAGYEVFDAVDGVDAWTIIERERPDLIVADVEMPRLDGFGLTHRIRSSGRFGDLPVILLTALETESDRIRGIDAGANAYLRKSAFDQTELLDTIGGMLP